MKTESKKLGAYALAVRGLSADHKTVHPWTAKADQDMHLFEAAVKFPDHQLTRLAHQVREGAQGSQVLFAR